ncbi:MAG: NAD(P)-dependent oxidoreductase [Sciscionella sp.]|nr:NAD(P)-dependent oxidoreductase [Sciscionella sp.]
MRDHGGMNDRVLPTRPVIGVLHPGAMGAALGSALKPVAGQVIWAAAGRSDTTAKRAEIADLVGVPTVAELARRSDIVVSICPPHAALDVAGQVASSGATPACYLDANAIAPATVQRIGALLGADHVVDGSIIGGPVYQRGDTVLWLSGRHAEDVAGLFDGSPFVTRVLGGELGAASALKACFALHSKAKPAIWLALAAAAEAYGILDEVRGELARDGVDLDDELASINGRARSKAWRWAGEMDEAAAALAAVDVPDGFSRAAAEIYRRLSTDLNGERST